MFVLNDTELQIIILGFLLNLNLILNLKLNRVYAIGKIQLESRLSLFCILVYSYSFIVSLYYA